MIEEEEEESTPDDGKSSCSKPTTSSLKNSGSNLKRPVEKIAYNGRTKIGISRVERRRRLVCVLLFFYFCRIN